ncbi:hypothetical protein A2567_00320 [Candidatus Azambacteria bacterium RIFOXYD1_FULL_42_11]|uniref:Uncharacterized protein n=4 Tax=Candidatus Azamiibacteriota TaxID=1752741 RepID=A0A0G0ZBB7_9BACT|nr:MAG: hypothetical protein UV07_C0008G0014 [Candidatus Azambacteria bacterium GW2011_GWB1_42_17]KKS46015.1 MAG: hypothetical protein UV10_C0009G0018 [Candidatus Azambacteria bacterium GW2011_GWA1_42_19]KKS76149.1 MAG: hypothetical protein UV48_C0001G0021 [Candidatus Azambacteria bacterium GW2011_GWA2_42_9]OGD43068.1 MAG: hypothetical protein A2567_00320 [Candidatus Azambacteria bacterium RIFOXYD1_FULL_42_11]
MMRSEVKRILLYLAIITNLYLIIGVVSDAFGDESAWNMKYDESQFTGIWFKTRYQNKVEIKTPIRLTMDRTFRRLGITLLDPKSAGFKFLMKITPRDFEKWQESVNNGAKDIFLTNNQRAYFVSGKETVKIDEITINTEQFEWLSEYKAVIEKNLKNCQMAPDKKGDLDMVCPPLLIEVQIIRIERSVLSPFLPTTHVFPHLNYIDIFVKILSIK